MRAKPVTLYLLLAAVVMLIFAIADGAELRRENAELRRIITGELAQIPGYGFSSGLTLRAGDGRNFRVEGRSKR